MRSNSVCARLTIDLSGVLERKVFIRLVSEAFPCKTVTIEALGLNDEGFINGIVSNAAQVETPGPKLNLEYQVTSNYSACMGSHRELAVNYPYFNSMEVFLSSGVLPVVSGYESTKESYWYDVKIVNVPLGWRVFTSLLAEGEHGPIPMEKVAQFFLYASPGASVHQGEDITYVVAPGVRLPVGAEEVFLFCKKSVEIYHKILGPNPRLRRQRILHLQAPSDYQKIAKGRTFATGENYTGGIALFGSEDIALDPRFMHPDYRDFVLFGLHHELGHAYTSAGPARFKSLIYASGSCPREDRQLIGEVLNSYGGAWTRALVDNDLPFSLREFFRPRILPKIEQGQRAYFADWLLFDLELRKTRRITVLDLYQAMIRDKLQNTTPFDSVEFVFETLSRHFDFQCPDYMKGILKAPEVHSYESRLRSSLGLAGMNWDALPSDRNATIRFFSIKGEIIAKNSD